MQSFCVSSHSLLQAQISGLGIDDPSRAQVAFDSDAQWRSSSHKVFLADEVTTTEFFKKYGNPNEIINGTISLSSTLPARCRASSTRSTARICAVNVDQQTEGRRRSPDPRGGDPIYVPKF